MQIKNLLNKPEKRNIDDILETFKGYQEQQENTCDDISEAEITVKEPDKKKKTITFAVSPKEKSYKV